MEGKEEDVRLGANKYMERQPIGTAAQVPDKDYQEPPPAPLFEASELSSWSFYRAGIAEFIATFLFLYVTVLTIMWVVKSPTKCGTVGIQGIAWAFGGMIFALVYCTAGISGGHINPAVTFGLFLARKLSLTRALYYILMQCLGAICGAGVVKEFEGSTNTNSLVVAPTRLPMLTLKAQALVLKSSEHLFLFTPFSQLPTPNVAPATLTFRYWPVANRVRAVFLVHLATIPVTGTGINPARSLGAAIIYNKDNAWDDHICCMCERWVFWVGPFIGAALAALYHQVVIRAIPFKSK